jgi:hypothetical protein
VGVKDKMEKKYILYIIIFLFGFLMGMLLIYKVEINTLNQALDSLRYCYETYGGFK